MGNYLRWVTGPLLLIATNLAALVALESMVMPDFPTSRLLGPVHPGMILAVASLGSCVLIGAMTLERRTSVVRLGVFVALCAGNLAVLAQLQDRPVAEFWAAYQAIQVGMTLTEVDAVLTAADPHRTFGGNWSWDGNRRWVSRVDTEQDYEGFELRFERGRLAAKRRSYRFRISWAF